MTVKDLKEILEGVSDDAEVLIYDAEFDALVNLSDITVHDENELIIF